jgi:hypothetical protein
MKLRRAFILDLEHWRPNVESPDIGSRNRRVAKREPQERKIAFLFGEDVSVLMRGRRPHGRLQI